MESVKQIRLGIGFLVMVSAPPYLIYDFHKIAKGQASAFHWFMFALGAFLVALSLHWLLQLRGENYLRWKSLWEKPVALAMLLLTSPVFLFSALLIRLESPGDAFYRQERIGQNRRRTGRRSATPGNGPFFPERRKGDRRTCDLGGRPYIMYKLRSMTKNAEETTGAAWSTGDYDPRVTRIGYYLRKTHIDELPQLYNVLLGQMSIVGPRPERPTFIAELSKTIDGYRKRLGVPPGITGLAQIRQKHDESLEDVRSKLKHDSEYIDNISLVLDVKIIFQTAVHMTDLFWEAFKRRAVTKATPKTVNAIFNENPER